MNIYTLALSRLDRTCTICGATISKNPRALAAHGKRHVEDGTAIARHVWASGNTYRTTYVHTPKD